MKCRRFVKTIIAKFGIWCIAFFFVFGVGLAPVLLSVNLPDAPTQLSSHIDGCKVFFSWKPSPFAVGYNLYYRSPGSDKYFSCNEKPILDTWFTYGFFDIPAIYHFVVRAVAGTKGLLESKDSNITRVETKDDMRVLQRSSIFTNGNGFIDIGKTQGMEKWSDPTPYGWKGFNVYMSDGGVTFGLVNREPIGRQASFVISKLKVDQSYYFVFTTIKANGDECYPSRVVSVVAEPTKESDNNPAKSSR
jgi:hypothetical protein